jgi:hypothetical protein
VGLRRWTADCFVFIVLDTVHRVVANTGGFAPVPVYYYNLSKPLVPSWGVNPGAMLWPALVLSGAAIWLFARRDVGARCLCREAAAARRPNRALPVGSGLCALATRSRPPA